MKKSLSVLLGLSFLLAVVGTAFVASSNRVVLTTTSTHVTTDTAVNTTPEFQKTFNSGNALNSSMTIQTDLTTITGTTGGVLRLFGSANGTTFVRILPTDSLVVDANHLSKIWTIDDNKIYSDIGVQYIGASSSTTKMNTVMIYQRE